MNSGKGGEKLINEGRAYDVLVVSASEKMNEALKPLLSGGRYRKVSFALSVATANRLMLENTYDFIIINSPLPDDFGTKLAIDASAGKSTVCMELVKTELYDDICAKVSDYGVFVLPKPTSGATVTLGLKWMSSAREKLRNLEKKTMTIEEKMEEIRIVNRAKWLLIENLNMTEPDAHRYIEKQAMDTSSTKREIAENIIKTYI